MKDGGSSISSVDAISTTFSSSIPEGKEGRGWIESRNDKFPHHISLFLLTPRSNVYNNNNNNKQPFQLHLFDFISITLT
jgi:hypothetical protein